MHPLRLGLLRMCVDSRPQSPAVRHSPYYFWGDEQLVALKVFSELTQAAAVGDLFPKLMTKERETRE